MLVQGRARPRPPRGKAQSHPGVHPLTSFSDNKFEPLPTPLGQPPYHFDLETAVPGITDMSKQLGKLVFHSVGDTGGVKNADYQAAVAAQMKDDLNQADNEKPRFFYHLGDVVYTTGRFRTTTISFTSPTITTTRPFFPFPAITMATRWRGRPRLTGGYDTS